MSETFFLYFFEFRINGEKFFIPLALPPQSLTLSEPFAVTETPTVDGGLFVEENGIVRRTLRMSGHFGMRQRRAPMPAVSLSAVQARMKDIDRSFHERSIQDAATRIVSGGRQVDRGQLISCAGRPPMIINQESSLYGVEHFRFLQDRVMRFYGDLKRNPATAGTTFLAFHNARDDEHWLVAPRFFTVERTAKSTLLHRYEAEFLVYDKTSVAPAPRSPDDKVQPKLKLTHRAAYAPHPEIRSTPVPTTLEAALAVLDTAVGGIRSAIKFVKEIVDKVKAAIAFVKTIINKIASIVKLVGKFIAELASIIDTVADFVEGVSDFIRAPFRAIAQIIDRFEGACANLVGETIALAGLFGTDADGVIRLFREIHYSAEGLAMFKDRYIDSAPKQNARYLSDTKPASGSVSRVVQAIRRASLPSEDVFYQSAEEVSVQATDTLESLALRRLGDARRWRDIAALNGLTAPYISRTRLPGTVRPGDRILVPSVQSAEGLETPTGILGSDPAESLTNRLLGVDLRIVKSADLGGRYDLAFTGGNDDLALAEGVANLVQAMQVRLDTELDTDPLYPNIGVAKTIGSAQTLGGDVLREMAYRQAVLEDPRILNIASSSLTVQDGDAEVVDIVAVVRGLADPVVTRIPLS